jgi:redox-regulated HSP33 family molecular chaperone
MRHAGRTAAAQRAAVFFGRPWSADQRDGKAVLIDVKQCERKPIGLQVRTRFHAGPEVADHSRMDQRPHAPRQPLALDVLHRFQLERAGVRGAFVHLERSWQELSSNGDYTDALGTLLGQAVAASALFTSGIKFDGRLSVQLQGSGSLRLLFAECTHDGFVRGIARCDEGVPGARIRLETDARLAITIENSITQTRYQGMVPVEGGDLASAFEHYFERSEQLPTRIVLAEAGGRCGGLMLQQIARDGGAGAIDAHESASAAGAGIAGAADAHGSASAAGAGSAGAADAHGSASAAGAGSAGAADAHGSASAAGAGSAGAADDDGWARVGHLLATMSERELLELPPEVLLLRLFHEEGVRLQPAQSLAFACTCSRERVEAMLHSLGRNENEETLREQGSVEVHCEFCNRRYVFDAEDIGALFGPDDEREPSATRH